MSFDGSIVLRFIISLVAFLFTITVLILFHEFGHLIVAKLVRIKVLRFSLGFGKRILKFKPKETEYAISAVPLGGYVKLSGDTPEEIENPRPGDYYSVGPGRRILMVLAGPVMNLVLAFLIFFIVGVVGYTEYVHEPIVGEIRPTLTVGGEEVPSPASQLGILPGDRFVEVNGKEIETWEDLIAQVRSKQGEEIDITVEREGERLKYKVTPLVEDGGDHPIIGVVGYQDNVVSMILPGTPAEKAGLKKGDVIVAVNGEPTSDYRMIGDIINAQSEPVELSVERQGVMLSLTMEPPADSDLLSLGFVCGLKERQVSEPLPRAFLDSATTTGVLVAVSVVGLYQIVTGQIPLKEAVGGPITMADFAGQTAMAGWQTLLRYVALLSIVLFILNLLPIPVLDGGNITLSIIELFRGKPVSLGFRMAFQQVGIFIVFGIMAFAIVMDVIRYAF